MKNILLFAAANTRSQPIIETGPEYQSIKEAFLIGDCHPLFDLSAEEVGPKLEEYQPSILHISAHGEINGQLVVREVIEGELRMDIMRFADFLADYRRHLRMVVFCVCHSDTMAEKVVRHIPVAIGFDGVLDDDKAKLFSKRFYTFLNEKPEDPYRAYLRAKKAVSLKGNGTPRFYFRETAPFRWNDRAWKDTFRLLQKKGLLASILSKADLTNVDLDSNDPNYYDAIYYRAFAEGKLFDLRNLVDNDRSKRQAPEISDFEDELILPTGFISSEPSQVQAVDRRLIAKDRILNFWQRRFASLGKEKKWEIALNALNVFDGNEIQHYLRAFRHYLPLTCRDKKGRGGKFVDFLFKELNDPKNKSRYFLLLGETGVGKTTALARLFVEFTRRKSHYKIIFIEANKGLGSVLRLENQARTILLLDGIDDTFEALHDAEAFFSRVEQQTRNFAKVMISCRTQFFVNQAAERRQTATSPPNPYNRIRLDFLDMSVVQQELAKKYRVGTEDYRTALSLVRQSGDLFKRPLLLPYIEDMVDHKDEFLFFRPDSENIDDIITSYEIYDIVIRKWIEREKELNPHYGGDYGQALFEVSLKLAQCMYERELQEGRQYIYYVDLQRIQRKHELQLGEIQLRDRSLLHRNAEGYFRFAHRTFKEFFYVQLLYQGLISEEEFPFDVYEDAARFYREMCQVQYFRRRKKAQRRLITPEKLDLPATGTTFSCRPLQIICHFESIDFLDSTFLTFKALVAGGEPYFDCFVDIAEYLINNHFSQIPEAALINVCDTYEVAVDDLLGCFFFCQTGRSFHFIHRSFAEFFCLYDLLRDEDDQAVSEAVEQYPFQERIHFLRLFAREIQWLQLRRRYDRLQLLTDDPGFSIDEYNYRKSTRAGEYSWVDYGNEKALLRFARFEDYLYRVRYAGTLRIHLQNEDKDTVLSMLPFPEWIKELDLSQNGLSGSLHLRPFINLETLTVRGNPELSLTGSELSAKLEQIIVEESHAGGEDLRSKFPKILFSENGDAGFTLGCDPFREPEMVKVEGGTFWMGSEETDAEAYKNEKPVHPVQLSDYQIGKYPVTVEEFARFAAETGYLTTAEREGWSVAAVWRENTLTDFLRVGCHWRHDVYGQPMDNSFALHPVIHVSWEDAAAYCAWLTQKTGKHYRLPSEAQWEFAAIGGHRAARQDEEGRFMRKFKYAGSDELTEVGWFFYSFAGKHHSDYSTQPVGKLQPNELGLYDMSGNVWEWCSDWYGDYPSEAQDDPTGSVKGSARVFRGGSWFDDARDCRATRRHADAPMGRAYSVGFRLVL